MIHLVTGKGGVGKSTYAAALALQLAAQGKRTLLIEFGEHSYQRHVFQTEVSIQPVAVQSHLWLSLWEGEHCLREYLLHLLKIEKVVQLFFDNKIMHALVQAAPALRELALLGKATSRERNIGPSMPYDELVIDAYATGHFRALMRAPRGMAEAIPFGPMGEQSRSISKVLRDPNLCRFYVVTTPEELPLAEALELSHDIQAELNQAPTMILNRVLNAPVSQESLARVPANEFAQYISLILERQEKARQEINNRGLKLVELPWIFVESPSERARVLGQGLQ